MTRAIFPGSFDPLHNGHVEIIERAHALFDGVIVAILRNANKPNPLFVADERRSLIEACFDHLANIEIVVMSTLVVDVAKAVGAGVIVRGLRAISDFENEMQMAQMNRHLSGVETVFIPTSSKHSFISSRLVREVWTFGGDVSSFVPKPFHEALRAKAGESGQ